jgi:HTH-type transcriptional regulator/antitoxin HigA
MAERIPAEAFPPGDYIKEELEERGWSQADLAEILGVNESVVSALINGKKAITPELAKGLSAAFETSAQVWMNLESSYRLFLAKSTDDVIGRKARLYDIAPVKELIKRGWIEKSENISVLEKRVNEFLSEVVPHAARKSTSYGAMNPAQRAWLCRAKRLARLVKVDKFSEESLEEAFDALRGLLGTPEDILKVPAVLAKAGIHLVVLEHLPQTRIDGACLWLEDGSPVIAISLRYDRLDYFWHTLLHEMAHVKHRDGADGEPPIDEDLVGDKAKEAETKPECEKKADMFACEFSVTEHQLTDFIARVKPFFSRQKIVGFANRLHVHPAIVVGQLQHRGLLPYSHSREMLVRVRDLVTQAALTDGWGHSVQARR